MFISVKKKLVDNDSEIETEKRATVYVSTTYIMIIIYIIKEIDYNLNNYIIKEAY